MATNKKILVVVLGATATGKTDATIALAKHFGSEIISADSRQVYHEMKIGVAAPDPKQLTAIPHHMVAVRSIHESYSSGQYEVDTLSLLDDLFKTHDIVFMTGGSGLYIDAVCHGMDDMPVINPELREQLNRQAENEGLMPLLEQLAQLDPSYFIKVDKNNPQRVIRGLEVCLQTGKTYSEFRTRHVRERPFRIIKIGIRYPREVLYERINHRVDTMLEQGLEQEAKELLAHRHLNALQTVGYKEFFDYFDDKISREEAIALIKQNSRRYAKRQETWFGRDKSTRWFGAGEESLENIIAFINSRVRQ